MFNAFLILNFKNLESVKPQAIRHAYYHIYSPPQFNILGTSQVSSTLNKKTKKNDMFGH